MVFLTLLNYPGYLKLKTLIEVQRVRPKKSEVERLREKIKNLG